MKRKNDASEYEARHLAESEGTSTTTEFPTVGDSSVPMSELILPVEETPTRKRRGLFSRRREKKEPLLIEREQSDEEPPITVVEVPDDTREISLSEDGEMEKTQVIELAEDGGSYMAEEEAPQLLLEGFADDQAEEVDTEPGREEALRRIRQEKIQDFSQRREQLEREVAEAAQAEETEAEEQPEVSADDAETESVQETLETLSLSAIRQQLQQQAHRSGVTLLVSVLVELILFFIAVISNTSPAVAMDPVTYLVIHLVLFGALMLANGKVLGEGFGSLFQKRRVTTEGVIAVTSVFTLIHTALLMLNTTGVAEGSAPVLTGVAGLGLLICQIAHRLELTRAAGDLAVFASTGEKLTAKHITDEATAEEIGRPAVALGVPRVSYFRRTQETEGYAQTKGYDPAAGFLSWYLPVTVVVSVVVALVYLLLNGFTSWIFAVTLLCGMLVISSPVLLLLSLGVTLFGADKQVHGYKAAVADYRAVETYGNMHGVALDAMELFPENSVLLHGIKTFSGTRIDEAILDAASVSIQAGGPLSHVFRRMVLNKVDMLHEVDTLVYEQDMGLSGWISGRRILIGNRKLLDNHGIDIPSKDYEERYAKNGRQLVYLSIAGELSAMFVVSYTADPTVRRVLKSITDRRVTLLIRTCDQNVTESLITSVFDLNGFYVELLNAPAGRSFETLVAGISQTEPSEIVSAGGALGMLTAFAQCRRLRTGVRLFTVLQALLGVFGIVLTAITALVSGALFPPLYAIEYLVGSSVLLLLMAWLFTRK